MTLDPTTLSLLIGGLLVLALVAYGLRDLLRFSFYRAWAIRGVVFRESVRRRVLWVTPLAMAAVLLLIQLQHPVDERDAIRQATRSCLLATALVAIVVALILASTNLPREITSRVIFTVVTKPITRLELLLGKIMGFAQLSAVVLLIMGGFTLIVLWTLDLTLTRRISTSLETALPVESRRPFLQYLVDEGLLQAQHIAYGNDLQVYAELPANPRDDASEPRYFLPGAYYAAFPFRIDEDLYEAVRQQPASRMVVRPRLHWKLQDPLGLLPGDPPLGIVNFDSLPPPPPPAVSVQVLDMDMYNLVASNLIPGNGVLLPSDPQAPWWEAPAIVLEPDQTWRVVQESVRGPVYVAVYGYNLPYLYGATGDALQIGFLDEVGREFATLMPMVNDQPRAEVLLRTYLGTQGIGLSGPEDDQPAPYGILAFRGVPAATPGADGQVDFELQIRVERLGGILDESDDTRVQADVHNVTTGFTSPPALLFPETGRTVILRVPVEAVQGGDFDLRLQTQSRAHIVSLRGADMKLVVARQPYSWNLFKALLLIWLLSILVIAMGLTFSTFVSWPIAVTLGIFALLGRWVAEQLGEAQESWGRQTADAIFGASGDAGAKEAVRVGVTVLNELYATVAAFLPNMQVYASAELLERGLAVDWSHIGAAAGVTFGFSLPLLALAYIVLRNKEVAP